jgi:predicted metal-dependent phosphoesterase TrpH
MWIRADFHTHPLGEGRLGPLSADRIARHLEAAVEAGIQCLAVTDHDEIRSALMAEDYVAKHNLPLLLAPGMEITTIESHLIAVGLREPVAGWRPLTETIEVARSHGATIILPHPAFAHLRERTDVDGMERFNSRYGDFPIEGIEPALVADSDAHNPTELLNSRCYTWVEVEELTWPEVVRAIREKRTKPQLKSEERDNCARRPASQA